MEGNASVYQVNPVSRITGEGRAEFLRTWGPDLYIYIHPQELSYTYSDALI